MILFITDRSLIIAAVVFFLGSDFKKSKRQLVDRSIITLMFVLVTKKKQAISINLLVKMLLLSGNWSYSHGVLS